MPHLTIDYSANLAAKSDLGALCRALQAALMATGLFELGAVRVRARACQHWAVADQLAENAFADMVLRIGEGRTEAERRALGGAVMAAAAAHFSDLLAEPHFALSLELQEISAAFSWKQNAIHPRLRGV